MVSAAICYGATSTCDRAVRGPYRNRGRTYGFFIVFQVVDVSATRTCSKVIFFTNKHPASTLNVLCFSTFCGRVLARVLVAF